MKHLKMHSKIATDADLDALQVSLETKERLKRVLAACKSVTEGTQQKVELVEVALSLIAKTWEDAPLSTLYQAQYMTMVDIVELFTHLIQIATLKSLRAPDVSN